MTTGKHILSWRLLFKQSILAVYTYLFMEWLFIATQPSSFMDALTLGEKLKLLFLTALIPAVAVLSVLIILGLLEWTSTFLKRGQGFLYVAAVLPALIVAALSLLLLDNFTYTIFQVGIITSRGVIRAGYVVLVLVLAAVWYRHMIRSIRLCYPVDADRKIDLSTWQTTQLWLAVVLLVTSLIMGGIRAAAASETLSEKITLLERPPHIILIGSDGTVAANMSLYGYERDTTPNLQELAKDGLLAENNFSNSAHSTGSVASMLTGKYPTETRVLYTPDILRGIDATQHLPGILRRAGYTTVQLGYPYYLDAYDVNMQQAFDAVNGRALSQGRIFDYTRRYHLEDAGFFLSRMRQRITDRLLHIFFIRDMPDPYRDIINPSNLGPVQLTSDEEKMDELIDLLQGADGPLFVQVHLMGTHGRKFYPTERVFSAGQSQDDGWMQDFFDDAVLEYDSHMGRLMHALNDNSLMDHTILVIYSDHANDSRTDDRIPLLFRFPRGEFSGTIQENTQNLDIAPTLLDYLEMEAPRWMSGQSLIRGEISTTRPIISTGAFAIDCPPPEYMCVVDNRHITPDFQQFGYIQLTICQNMYTLMLETGTLATSHVRGHTAQCPSAELPDRTEAHQVILDYLIWQDFDISTLEQTGNAEPRDLP